MKDNYMGEQFLDKLYQNLYMSDEVQHTKENKDNRTEAIRKYLERLERVHSKANTETKKALLEKLYFDKYIIKEENIPNWLNKKDIINIQKKSLKLWLDYLSNPTASYPMWTKFWAFQGMLKMGSYDELKELYLKRNKKTTAPFVSANPEIIAKSIETIINLVNGEEVDEKISEKLNKTDSFSKIYSFFEKKYKENVVEKSESNDGKWIKYNQGNKEDAINLSKSLENMNTGWCTASEDMAIKQVCGPYNDSSNGGDFYVYYTKDKEGNYIIPRIAMRMINHDKIGEIRGILDGQNLEDIMVEILESKLKEMSFLNSYDVNENLEKVNDLRNLTIIGKKTEKNEKLTEQELMNLYSKKYGFGWTQDPRVAKILKKRNILDDFNKIPNKTIKIKMIVDEIVPANSIDDREIVFEAVKKDSVALKYASLELRSDKKLVLEAVKQDGRTLEYASEELRSDKEVVLEAIKQSRYALKYASEELKNDKEIVLEALKEEEFLKKYDSEKLRTDKKILLEAVKKDRNALMCASKELKSDKEFILKVVKQRGNTLEFTSDKLKNDKEVVLEAVKQDGRALEYASEELRSDKEVVLEAVKKSGRILMYASEELRNDEEVVLEAAKRDYLSVEYASEELKNNKKIMLEVVKQCGYILQYTSKELKNDKEVVLEAVKQNGRALQYASEKLRNDKEVVLEAVKQDGEALQYALEELRSDKEVVLEAVKQSSYALKYASEELRNDKKVALLSTIGRVKDELWYIKFNIFGDNAKRKK